MKRNLITVLYPDDFVFSYIHESDDTVENILERVFANWNHGSGMECKLFVESKKRSLSVNDIVAVNFKYFQCKSFGWKEVTTEFVNQLEKKVAAHPLRSVHGAHFALGEVMYARRHDDNKALLEVAETV